MGFSLHPNEFSNDYYMNFFAGADNFKIIGDAEIFNWGCLLLRAEYKGGGYKFLRFFRR